MSALLAHLCGVTDRNPSPKARRRSMAAALDLSPSASISEKQLSFFCTSIARSSANSTNADAEIFP
jgi:hypothetical protein